MSSQTADTQVESNNVSIPKFFTKNINNLLGHFGYGFSKRRPAPKPEHFIRRQKLLETYNIDTLLDVGANIGQYSKRMRKHVHYNRRIISFEPMEKEFLTLSETAKSDPLWEVEHFALGNENGTSEIQISGNSVSSSMLDMLPSVLDACTEKAAYVGKEAITVKTLDSIFDQYCTQKNNIFLKIDTQGYERTVLEGALESLPHISGLQLEMSLMPFYKGEILYNEMIDYVSSLGFKLMSMEPALEDSKTGRQLQFDGVFFREK